MNCTIVFLMNKSYALDGPILLKLPSQLPFSCLKADASYKERFERVGLQETASVSIVSLRMGVEVHARKNLADADRKQTLKSP